MTQNTRYSTYHNMTLPQRGLAFAMSYVSRIEKPRVFAIESPRTPRLVGYDAYRGNGRYQYAIRVPNE